MSAVGLAVLVALVAAVASYGALAIEEAGGYDAGAFLEYAEVLDEQGRLPREPETYEYATPPAYPWLTVQLHRIGESWTPGQGLSVLWTVGLLVVAWLLARELWPERPWLWLLAAAVTAAIPIVVRLGTMFHPEMQFSFFAVLALLLVVRGARSEWPLGLGLATGAALGVAALTRPTAAVVIASLGIVVLLAGRRAAVRYAAAAAVAVLVLAGPWWIRQTLEYGNPLQSNLERYLLADGQPREFYVSAPLRELVTHPYRPAFAGELWPQFHADLWSDWFGGQHAYWREEPSRATRFFLSSQSVLGLLVTPLALGGLLAFGSRALRRVARGGAAAADVALAAGALLAALSWIAFVVQLVRFPQAGGDPIKSSYMLYLSPVFAVAAVAAARALWARSPRWRAPLVALGGAYAVSYTGFLLTSWP